MNSTEAEISEFLMENVKSLRDQISGEFYRASAYLRDDTYLPCVTFANPEHIVNLAIRRFHETLNTPEHRLVVQSFVANGTVVPIYQVERVELSPYAWPEELLDQIHGETVMGWTFFAATMKDGMNFTFATSTGYEFFDLPEGYSYKDIVEIHSGTVADEHGRLNEYSLEWSGKCYRDKPFFRCYTDCLPES
ncbi:MAG TPA: hypothetical protein VFR78_17875 [Pyrinomonadaceae bacterium]|nr:hypothetical protein [Pyrinomonadaceae bacterium]